MIIMRCTTALLALLVATAPVAASTSDQPQVIVRQVTDRVIEILQQKDLPNNEKRAKIELIVMEYVDFETLSKLVIARNWSKFSPEQQQEFMTQFQEHLARTYGRRLDDYRNEKVVITGEHEEARGDRTVNTKVPRGETDILVDYRLRQKDGSWKMIDIVIEGVSLVANFRSQFQGIVSSGGPEKLIQLLREKNARAATAGDTEA
jgi:phospholipid transport system substrate-binding protein